MGVSKAKPEFPVGRLPDDGHDGGAKPIRDLGVGLLPRELFVNLYETMLFCVLFKFFRTDQHIH